ncbi:MAG: DUF3368 domain-containing protein [Spirulinaceae cyanobacterium]
MKIVFNTSPLLFLARLNVLEIFLNQPGKYHAPQAVRSEITAKEDEVCQFLDSIFAQQRIQVSAVQTASLVYSLNRRLGKGESEAIALAIELEADYVILDDFAARREASRLGLAVKGTLAVIKKLQQDQLITIDDLDEFYATLMTIKFRVKRSLLDAIFNQV